MPALRNPATDARLVADTLRRIGFQVSKLRLEADARRSTTLANDADVAFEAELLRAAVAALGPSELETFLGQVTIPGALEH